MLDLQELLLSVIKNLDENSTARKLLDKALEEQDYVYNEEGYFKSIHTNPLFAAFDDPSIFKIGDIVKNKNSGITAEVTIYLDGAYGLSNGCSILAKNKDDWKLIRKSSKFE